MHGNAERGARESRHLEAGAAVMAARNRVRHAPPRAAVPHPSQVATATRSAPGDAQRGAAGDFVLLGSGCIGREGSRLVAEEDTWVSAMANAETVCSAAKVMMSTYVNISG